jgi:hypothetical protein
MEYFRIDFDILGSFSQGRKSDNGSLPLFPDIGCTTSRRIADIVSMVDIGEDAYYR